MTHIQLKTGLRGMLAHEVTATDLATNWRNDIPVLATPILLWLAELTCMRAIEGTLEPGQMTLGHGHRIQHSAPTPAGWRVNIEAVLVQVENKILTFDIEASDGVDTILTGQHSRAIVNKDRFLARIAAKGEIVAGATAAS